MRLFNEIDFLFLVRKDIGGGDFGVKENIIDGVVGILFDCFDIVCVEINVEIDLDFFFFVGKLLFLLFELILIFLILNV